MGWERRERWGGWERVRGGRGRGGREDGMMSRRGLVGRGGGGGRDVVRRRRVCGKEEEGM